uniref:Aamy domain-containing protein n=1 Tax=Macrostomum lignano TaxID=282301 RepID=A0A1I8IUF0_9PLAT
RRHCSDVFDRVAATGASQRRPGVVSFNRDGVHLAGRAVMVLQLLSISAFLLLLASQGLEAKVTSDWWKEEIIYQVYPRSFRDSDGDGVGDIQGIIEKLDYISGLGARAVWLSPVYPSPMADFGYDISNHTDIDPVFGSLADFDQLVREIHKRGMYLVMDFVPNHTSDRHPWFEASRRDPADPYGDFYVWTDCRPQTKAGEAPGGVNNWLSCFGGSAWQFDPIRGQCYQHQFCAQQPDLNFRHAGVREAMRSVVRFWLERGVDGFRVDAVKHLFEDPMLRDEPVAAGPEKLTDDPADHNYLRHDFTTDYNETYDVMAEWRLVLDEVAGATGRRRLLVAEAYSDLPALMRYYSWRGKALADFPFNFGLLTASGTERGGGGGGGSGRFCNAACLRTAAQRFLNAAPEGAWPNWVLGNHDNSRLSTRFPPEGRFVRALNTLLLTLPGTPTCYYGDELGMSDLQLLPEQMVDPLGRRFPEQSRDPARGPMLWSEGPQAGFTDGPSPPWLPVESGFGAKCVARQLRMPNSTLAAFQAVAELRRQREFLDGELRFLMETEAELLAYWRGTSANTEPLVLDLSASGCRSLSLVADFRAANRNDFSVSGVAMQPGDAIIAKAADCKPDQLELRVFQRTQPLVAMVIWLRLLSAAASSPLIGPAIGQNPQLLSDIIQVTRANWELAFALDLDEFDGTSSERLSYLMKKVLMGGKTVLKLFDLNSMPGSNSSSSMALSYRLLESRTKLDQLHLDAVNNMSNRMDLVWRRKFERSCLLAMAGSRMLDNSIGLPPAERAHELTRLRQMISSESQELLAIWRSMSGTDKASANSLLELAINSTDGKDWRGSLTFLLAMARTVVRSGELSIVSVMISQQGGMLQNKQKLVRTLLHTWSMRMESIVEILKRWSEEIRKLYETNLEPMVRKFVKDSGRIDSRLLTLGLQALLSDTFPWRHWIVLAYLEQKSYGGNTGTSVFFCEGLYLSKVLFGGQTLVVASSQKSKTKFRADSALSVLESAEGDGPKNDDAFLWQQHAMPRFGTPCVTAAFFGALCYGRCFMVWAARPDRVAYRLMRTAGFMTHALAFG